MSFEKSDFTLTAKDLSTAHGVSDSCIYKWTREGAFPHLKKGSDKGGILYPAQAASFTGGRIKENISKSLYAKPIFLIEAESEPAPTKQGNLIAKHLMSISNEVRALSDEVYSLKKTLIRIESKLHAVSEGRKLGFDNEMNLAKPTIGDMVRNSTRN